jgi:acetyltransferase-like isoleucine patch superfamily enzyme
MAKAFIKQVFFGFMALVASPFTLFYLLLSLLFRSDSLFATFSQLFSLFPGKIGSYLRAGFYRFTMQECSPNVVVSFATLFSQKNTIIEAGVYIGPQCNIGKCNIEKDCLIGSGVHILSGKNQHNFSDLTTPIRDQGGNFTQVTIGENTWIGNGAIIMANIGKHCIVAAGSVVINDIEDYSIVAGNPAKVIKKRQ